MPARLKISIGNKYNRLTIIKEINPDIALNGEKVRKFKCKCDCGNIHNVKLYCLRGGMVKSCGCLHKEMLLLNKTHGFSQTKIYKVWNSLRSRCNNIKCSEYHNYGGRGITYDKKWEKFEGFWNDMGLTFKEGLQIDRIDNDLNYCKENCRWVTPSQNSRNKRNLRYYKGKCLAEWCEELGLKYSTISARLRYGWTYEKALGLDINKN